MQRFYEVQQCAYCICHIYSPPVACLLTFHRTHLYSNFKATHDHMEGLLYSFYFFHSQSTWGQLFQLRFHVVQQPDLATIGVFVCEPWGVQFCLVVPFLHAAVYSCWLCLGSRTAPCCFYDPIPAGQGCVEVYLFDPSWSISPSSPPARSWYAYLSGPVVFDALLRAVPCMPSRALPSPRLSLPATLLSFSCSSAAPVQVRRSPAAPTLFAWLSRHAAASATLLLCRFAQLRFDLTGTCWSCQEVYYGSFGIFQSWYLPFAVWTRTHLGLHWIQ